MLLALVLVSGALLLISGAALAFAWGDLPARVVLHFLPGRGADLFGTPGDLLTLWILGVGVAGINTLLAQVFYDRARELTYLFAGANVLITLILFIAIGTIISVN